MAQEGTEKLKHVVIYTDGAAEPNPGPGGYGVVLQYGSHRKELAGGYEKTTNNRMELMAAIVGLESLTTKCAVTIHSDSQYLVNAVNDRSVFKWREKNWRRTGQGGAKNVDLWERFLTAYEKHEVSLVWVKGHAGIAENERCDQLAFAAARAPGREVDPGYVAESVTSARRESPKSAARTKHKREGEPCRKCGTPLVKQIPKKKPKRQQNYYYEWYLLCPQCRSMYMVEEAKRRLDPTTPDNAKPRKPGLPPQNTFMPPS
jgi:ribonuclease HI